MNYNLKELEDQIIHTLGVQEALGGVNIRTHTGEINPNTFSSDVATEGFIRTLPFIFIQYAGRRKVSQEESSTKLTVSFTVRFRLYIGAKSLREKRDAQLSCYDMLASVWDTLHGRFFKAVTNQNYQVPFLQGDTIPNTFVQMSPIEAPDGESERLIVNIPSICVYQSDYQCDIVA